MSAKVPNVAPLKLSTAVASLDATNASAVDDAAYRAAALEEDSYQTPRRRLFAAICVLNVAMNFDSGVLPAVLNIVQDAFQFSYTELGFLGALVYVGTVMSCPLAGYLMTRHKQRRVLLAAVTGNAIGCFWFALAGPEGGSQVGKWNMYCSKFLIGLTQSSVMIYAPVWVDEFAPVKSATTWMSVLQVNVVTGIVIGYVVAGLCTENIGPQYWRVCIFCQACLLACYIPIFMFVDGKHINSVGGRDARLRKYAKKHRARLIAESIALSTPNTRDVLGSTIGGDGSSSETESDASSPVRQLEEDDPPVKPPAVRDLFKSPIYLLLTLSLCGLYFEVTGIQFWATNYMLVELKEPKSSVLTWFALTTITGPTTGVVFGGWLVDRLGGYSDDSGQQAATTLKVCFGFGMGAMIMSVPAALIHNFAWVMGSLWLVLFFGGALLPPATGVCISAVPPEARSLSSSYAFLAYNLLGYASAPMICGWVSDVAGLRWGFRIIMFSSFVSCGILFASWQVGKRNFSRFLHTPKGSEQQGLLSRADTSPPISLIDHEPAAYESPVSRNHSGSQPEPTSLRLEPEFNHTATLDDELLPPSDGQQRHQNKPADDMLTPGTVPGV